MEKLVVVRDDNESNIRPDDLAIDYEHMEPETATVIPPNRQNQDLQTIALHFAKYLLTCTKTKAFTSQACKHVYQEYPPVREILSRYGKLRGLMSQSIPTGYIPPGNPRGLARKTCPGGRDLTFEICPGAGNSTRAGILWKMKMELQKNSVNQIFTSEDKKTS